MTLAVKVRESESVCEVERDSERRWAENMCIIDPVCIQECFCCVCVVSVGITEK